MARTFFKVLSLYLTLAMVLMTLPSHAWCMFIPSGTSSRQADFNTVQTILESKIVSQRLIDLGLSREQASDRMKKLSDEQLHQFASKLDAMQAGADLAAALIIVLLVAVLVVGILELSGHTVIIR